MPGEATEVGSIIGYLVLNRSDWLAGVRATERDADKLGRLNPDIRIQTNAGIVIAQLGLVDTATKRIGTSADKAKPPVIGLLGALAALAPAAIPIAAVVGGAMIGLLPTMAAVLLGVSGISAEFKSGQLEGTRYGQDISQLQGFLAQLKQTAAGGILPGVDQAVRTSHPLFALINSDVGEMSGQIGHIIGSAGPAFLTLFTQLNPLFVTFGSLISRGSDELLHFAQNSDGVSGFVTYVQAELPQVMAFLGNLIILLTHITQAAAPMGGVILGGLGLLVRVLDSLPIGVLQILIPLLTAAYTAFKTYAGITFLVSLVNTALEQHAATALATSATVAASEAAKAEAAAVSARARMALVAGVSAALEEEAAAAVASAETQAAASASAAGAATAAAAEVRGAGAVAAAGWASMIGPVSALAVGVGILAFGLLGNKKNAQDTAAAMNSYADSVKQSTDALNTANIAQTNKNLADKNAFSNLDLLEQHTSSLVLSYHDLTLAVNGTDAQYQHAMDALSAYQKQLSDKTASKGWVDGAHEQFDALTQLKTALNENRKGLQDRIDTQQSLNSADDQATAAQQRELVGAAALYHLHGTAGVAAYLAARQAAQQNTDQTKAQTLAFQMENDAASILQGTLDRLNGKRLSAADALNAFQSALVNLNTGATAGTPGTPATAAQQNAATTAQARHKIAVDALAQAQSRYNAALKSGTPAQVASAHLALERAQLAVKTSTDAVSAAMAKLGGTSGTAGTAAGTIQGMDAASVQLRGELNNQIHLLEQLVEANGGWQNSTAKSRAEMAQLRQQIIDNAVAHGVDRKAVTDYVDSLFKIPKSIPPTKLDIDTAQAKAKALAYKKWFQENLGNLRIQAQLASNFVTSGGTRSKGGLIEGATAGGGTVDGPGTSKSDSIIATLPNGNGWRLSKGEEVIQEPFASQWRPLLKAINNGKLTMPSQNLAGRHRGSDGDSTIQQLMSLLAARSAGVGIEHFEQHNHYPLPETPSDSTPKVLKAAAMALDVF